MSEHYERIYGIALPMLDRLLLDLLILDQQIQQ
jgi:hypothetical protein